MVNSNLLGVWEMDVALQFGGRSDEILLDRGQALLVETFERGDQVEESSSRLIPIRVRVEKNHYHGPERSSHGL